MQGKFIAITAGPFMWGQIRRLAFHEGLAIEESKGWLSRSFRLSGDPAALQRAATTIQAWNDNIDNILENKET